MTTRFERGASAGTWEVRWKTTENESRKRRFRGKPEALRFKTEVEHKILSQTYVDPAAGKKPFKEYAEEWRAIQIYRPGTESQVKIHLKKHVYPRLGNRPIASVRRSEVQTLITAMEESLAPRPSTW